MCAAPLQDQQDVLHVPLELAEKAQVQLARDVRVTATGWPSAMQGTAVRLTELHQHMLQSMGH